MRNLDSIVAFVIIGVVVIAIVIAIDRQPPIETIQPIHVELDAHTLPLSVLLSIADQHERCEEDEFYWFTGDFDGEQWTRGCIPMDRMVQ